MEAPMRNCTATLTLMTRTDEVVAGPDDWHDDYAHRVIPDGMTMTRDGGRLLRADVTVLTCVLYGHSDYHADADGRIWKDDWPGATPHRDPMDELVRVSEEAGLYDDPCPDCGGTKHDTTGPVYCPAGVWRCHPCPSCGGSEARALGFIDPPQHDRHIYDWLMGRAEELEHRAEPHPDDRAAIVEAAAAARQENRDD